MSSTPARASLVLRWLTLVGVAAALCAGCDSPASPVESGRSAHADGDGPLSASAGAGGGSSLAAPDRERWWGSFGSFLLCLDDPEADVVLTDVRNDVVVAPRRLVTWLRLVPPAPDRAGLRGDWRPFISALGRPTAFKSVTYRGAYQRQVRGVTVAATCPVDGQGAWMELVVSMLVDGRGGQVRKTFVDYTADGDERTLRIDWELAACGTQVEPRFCD